MTRRNDGPWRVNVLVARGAYCRACGSTKHIEVDHIWPRGQQGPSVVENGLPLCGTWGDCGAHALKTAGRLMIERSWLDPDQIEWLAEVGWVQWSPVDGAVTGRGWRHFAPIDPHTGLTRTRAHDEILLTPPGAAQPEEAHMAPDEPTDEIPEDADGYTGLSVVPDDGTLPDDDLAAAADAAMAGEPEPTQDHLDGTNYARMKFVGMAWEQPERPGLKEEVELIVRGICVGHEEQVMADGDIRELAKIKVTSIERNLG